ncbi:MAG: type II secretion system protein [Planctomycetota bacterium]|nr:type II secretion system protein [Planctomycetota bacterium]
MTPTPRRTRPHARPSAGRLPAARRARAARRSSTGAFTLIELLVVLAIITIIVSITLPAVAGARESGRRTKCLANLKGIAVGLQLYMDQESKGLLPRVRPLNDGANENDPSLLDIMGKYTDAALPFRENGTGDWISPDPWRCPSDRSGGDAATDFKPLWQSSGTSYEYLPAFVMVAAETLTVRNPHFGVSKAYENFRPALPVLIDADDWHNPRFEVNRRSDMSNEARWERNAVFYGDWRAEKSPFFGDETVERLVIDTIQFGGGLGG